MFHSLRAKLVTSYSLLILLCLLLAGSAFVIQLREYQRQIRMNQLADLAVPISWQVRLLERAGASSEQVSAFLQERSSEMGLRILLIDSNGVVMEDSAEGLVGDRIQMSGNLQQRREKAPSTDFAFSRAVRQGYVFIATSGPPPLPSLDRTATRSSTYSVVLAVPEQSLTESWLELAPSLSGAALLSLIVSIGIAWLLSRSISKPVTAITRASEEMAKGNYDQYIPVHGQDEVGRLAEAFNRMARQVSTSHRTLRDFLANVSHDLRTPLTSIQGFSQAMVDGTVQNPQDYAEAARIINDEAERMRQLVEDLLLLSKIETGQMPMDRSSLDLRELLRTAVKRIAPKAQQLGVEVVLQADDGATIIGDENRLDQLFQNLLNNAVRHTPPGGTITVGLSNSGTGRTAEDSKGQTRSLPGIGTIRATVHNTGSYILPEEQDRIFERFYQVDRARERNGDGVGLGLAIAEEIAVAHGARISVASDPANGTTFTIAFSLKPSAISG